MLRFFRTLRRKLIEESNFRRYLLYAIGEVLLVVIGILIALQVNNWNEERKSRHQEITILTNMLTSVVTDTSALSRNIELIEEIQENANWLREQLDSKAIYTQKMDTAFAKISIFAIREPNYTVFDNLESVGISIITNDSLRNEISNYYSEYEELVMVDDYFEINKYFRQEIYPKYFKNYQYGNFAIPVDKDAIYTNTEFSVVLDYSINDTRFYIRRLRDMYNHAVNLIALIENEIAD